MNSPNRQDMSALSALALVGQLGLIVALPVAGMAWLGSLLDQRLGTGGLVIVAGILLGLAGGIYGAWRIIKKEMDWTR